MAQKATPRAIRTMDALDLEGKELFDEAWFRAAGEDGWGENHAAHVIAQSVPDPIALTYRNLVVRCTELVDAWLREIPTGHVWNACEVQSCQACNEFNRDAVLSWLLEELNARRQAWLDSDDTPDSSSRSMRGPRPLLEVQVKP